MNRFVVASAIETLLNARLVVDPAGDVPVYDLHDLLGASTGYCLVRDEVLDELWRRVNPGAALPHAHIDPSTAFV